MSLLKTAIFTLSMLMLPVCAFSSEPGYLRINLIEGDVQIKTPDAGEWGLAYDNGPLTEGDQVWVPQGGRVELQLNNGSFLRLDEGSALQILSMDSDNSQFYLSQGRAYIYFDAPGGSVIQFDTPDSSVRAFDRANFSVDISDQYTDVAVYKGFVKTENSAGMTRINAGEMISLGSDTNGEIAPLGPADAWGEWNNARNRRFMARRDDDRYLPPELRVYSSDLDDNGRWVQVPEYGYVWSPTVVNGSDWAPYRSGRWVWRGGDYIWIGFEPWGWAPYHYGRWAFVAGTGWCWVPPIRGDVFWAPGYVGWVRTPEYVGWVPLAPGETYYGRGNHGRHSVNITNVNITQINITTIYRNVQAHNGATIVSRNSFTSATPTVVNINRNAIQQRIFVKDNISVGTPQIKPARENYFVSGRAVPEAKLPPRQIRNARVDDVKRSRPFIREPEISVINRGSGPKELDVIKVDKPRTPGKERPRLHEIAPSQNNPGPPDTRIEKDQGKIYERRDLGERGMRGGPEYGGKPQAHPIGGSQPGALTGNGGQDEIYKKSGKEAPKVVPPVKEKPDMLPTDKRERRFPGNNDYELKKRTLPNVQPAPVVTPPRPLEKPKSFPAPYGNQATHGTPPPDTINQPKSMPGRDKGEVINREIPRVDRPHIQIPQPAMPTTPATKVDKPQFQNLDKSMGKPPKELTIKEEKKKSDKVEKPQAKEPGTKGEKRTLEPYGGNTDYQNR